jgi:hypothetical protein
MDDMTAFERQVGEEIFRIVGPARPVDDLAVFESAATTPHTRRFQSMFSATKFVVAGAIVALLGGFLLTGMLRQPSEAPVPPIAASAWSPTEPTDTATPAPVATAETESTPADLLPGVDLITEEVEPGVFRVLGDGAHDLTSLMADPIGVLVATGHDGSVWLQSSQWAARLGEPGRLSYPMSYAKPPGGSRRHGLGHWARP